MKHAHAAALTPVASAFAFAFAFVVLVLGLGSGPASAQWHVEAVPSEGGATNVAAVEDESGHQLRVFVDASSVVRGEFSLGAGFSRLEAETCPTIHIDDHPPIAPGMTGVCVMEETRARFAFGEIGDDAVRANPLVWMMHGSRLVFFYRLERLGYRRVEFSLRGSRQALDEALGDIRVLEE